MLNRNAIAALTLAAALALALPMAGALAFDESKYPDFSGQWRRPPGIGTSSPPTARPRNPHGQRPKRLPPDK